MNSFDTAEKNSNVYLDLAANGNGNEKAMFVLEALSRLKASGTNDVDVIEIGPGGGAALQSVTNAYSCDTQSQLPEGINISFLELDGIESESLRGAREKFAGIGTTDHVKGDARDMATLFPARADVVAASAVLHEVYSYGSGYEGVDQTLQAVAETVKPNGYFAYRDVFSVENESQHERKRHIYDKEGWVLFAKQFLPYYLANATHPYHHEDDKVVFEQDSTRVLAEGIDPKKYLSISAPVGVLRELQRHYITLRDFCWREGALGISPVLEGPLANDWLDIKKGSKRVYYKSDDSVLDDNLLEVLSEDAADGYKVVDGDTFDSTTDAELGRFLHRVLNEDEAAVDVWNKWLSREGSETYVYMTIGRLLGSMAMRSLEVTDGKRLLVPERPSDVMVIQRRYYNRYLQQQLSNPLPDAKQLILFRSIDVREDAQGVASAMDVLTEHSTRETISRIYGPIRKAKGAK
jgi:hypothetical protein